MTSLARAAEEVLGDLWVGQYVAGIAGVDHLAAGHDVTSVGARQRETGVLLDDEDRDALLSERVDAIDDLLLVERREGDRKSTRLNSSHT